MSCEDTLRELTTHKSNLEAFIKAWEAVTFPTKKNGEPFAIKSKNFAGARLYTESYRIVGIEDSLKVYATRPNGSSITDEYFAERIDLYATVEREDRPWTLSEYYKAILKKAKEKPQNVKERGQWVKDAYVFDLDDAKEAIAEHITKLKKRVEYLTKQIAVCEKAYTYFGKKMQKLRTELEQMTHKEDSCDLYYALASDLRKIL